MCFPSNFLDGVVGPVIFILKVVVHFITETIMYIQVHKEIIQKQYENMTENVVVLLPKENVSVIVRALKKISQYTLTKRKK
jgi:hypothetical protein